MGFVSPEGYLDQLQDDQEVSLTTSNCTTTEAALGYRVNDTSDVDDIYETYADEQQHKKSVNNVSHLKTMTSASPSGRDWEQQRIKLKFPKGSPTERYKMTNLHLDRGIFAFDFVRRFLLIVQPNDLPLGNLNFH